MEKDLLLYNLWPTAAQVRTALLVALLLLVASLAILPFRSIQLGRIDAFVPVICTALLLGDWIIAMLFFAQASVLRSKALIALGTGYFFSGLILIPNTLAFPWAFAPNGLLGGGPDTPLWLYAFWHGGLPVSVIAYTLLKNAPDWPHTTSLSPRKVIAICLVSATALVGVLTLLVTVGEPLMPRLLSDHTQWRPAQVAYLQVTLMSLTAGAMAMTWRRRGSVLDLSLLLVLWAWLLELFLTTLATYRFSIGWYSGRVIGILAALAMLPMLLAQTNRLYAQTVLQLRARERDRENRLLVRDAVAAAIVHELRQPLAAIMMNAQAGRRSAPGPNGSMSSILDEIVSDTRRANDIMESTRTMFGQPTAQKTSSDINKLIRDTIGMIHRDLRDRGVTVDLRLDDSLPPIAANRVQMQQVFFNLFTNAAEAMSAVTNGPRILTVRSGRRDDGLVISVEDTGSGIAAADQDRIFDGFFTTKTHGSGLGLPICRSVISAHGGWIRPAARKPKGTMFEIYLPLNGVVEPAA